MLKLFYKLTAYVPRPLPKTEEEYLHFKMIMHEYYGVPDTDEAWATMASQVQGVPQTKLRKDFGSMANAVKRRDINAVAQEQKVKHFAKLNTKLIEAAQAQAARATSDIPVPERAFDLEGKMLGVPETQGPLV